MNIGELLDIGQANWRLPEADNKVTITTLNSAAMKRNMSQLDGIIRITIALVIAMVGYFELLPLVWIIVLGVIAVIFLFTGAINFCPIYKLFGISTKNKNKRDKALLDSES